MTWKDYRPIPGTTWADNSVPGSRVLRVALVAVDFPDQPFVITMPKGSDLFGNPQVDPVKREQVPQFYADFWGKPGPLNHGHTIHEFWMEQSRGKVGIPKIDAYGPYKMPRNLFEYGLNEWGQEGACPTGFTCNARMEPDVDALWTADKGADIKKNYDIILRIYAGYDETSVWQEFGEMKFASKEDIPAEWGNPDTTKPRWVTTRYVPWTSWKAGAQQWGLSSVRQGENSGTITHEIAHFAFRTGDNNNNPYATPYRRVGSGPWDVMDRGSFNGPGGPHRRWVVPANEGASMPAGFMLRNRIRFEFVRPEQVLQDPALLVGQPHLAVLAGVQQQLGTRAELVGADGEDRGFRVVEGAKLGAHPGQQLRQTERLGDVVIGAGIETTHHVGFGVGAGQHDDRRGVAVAPELGAEVAAIGVRQADIQQDGVVADIRLCQPGGCVGGTLRRHGDEAAVHGDLLGEGGAQRGVVFDDEDGAGGHDGDPGPGEYAIAAHWCLKTDPTLNLDVQIRERDDPRQRRNQRPPARCCVATNACCFGSITRVG